MKTAIWIIIVIVVVAVGAWAIAAHHNSSTPTTTSTTSSQSTTTDNSGTNSTSGNTTGSTSTPVLSSASSASLGTYLTATNGMTLYKYTKDTPGVSNCTGVCAVTWPPYTVTSAAALSSMTGITGSLGTITRADGTLQVTYNNVPLYFYAQDSKVGDTTGQNVGEVWFVVAP